MGDYMAYQHGMKDGDVHPVIKAMNTLGYEVRDARQTMNSNYGPRLHVQGFWAGANFPIVWRESHQRPARCRTRRTTSCSSKPYLIVEKDHQGMVRAMPTPIKIGFIGLCNRRRLCSGTSRTSKARHRTRDIVEAAKAWVSRDEGRKAPISSSRCRIPASTAVARQTGWKNASLYVAAVDGIDANLHRSTSTSSFPARKAGRGIKNADPVKGTLQGKPAVMAGFLGFASRA